MNLDSDITKIFRTQEPQRKALNRLRIETVRDLLYHFPARYGDTAEVTNIMTGNDGDEVTLYGRLSGLSTGKTYRSNMSKSTAKFTDETGSISVTWFRQPYIAKMLHNDMLVKISGKISVHNDKKTMNNPKVEQVTEIPLGVGDNLFGQKAAEFSLYPVYPESKGITSNWIYHSIRKIFNQENETTGLHFLDQLEDPIPSEILKRYNLPSLKTALIWIHTPHKKTDSESARKRFAFEEIFMIQLKRQMMRKNRAQKKSFKIAPLQKDVKTFVDRFPFKLTEAQSQAIADILADFKQGNTEPMGRLLEGDVGSGKTVIAAATVYATAITRPDPKKNFGRLQTAYMVPTEILAKQHFESFIHYFEHLPIKIALITGSGCQIFPSKVDPTKPTKISRAQLLKWLANGEIPILIGTHSLIQKTVNFKNLAYVIIDEQHRFGTMQRQALSRKDDFEPHLLSMTATPIPRTLALTIFGDLDLTVVDQMPMGRKPIITELIMPKDRDATYGKIHQELEDGRQAYVICPRIDEPDPDKQTALNVKSVKAEAKRLQAEVFQEYHVGILHSKMKPTEKENIMKQFENGVIDVLVSTSVVEVGVNVPNATVIIIEGAERFGLSQLHQLRGRVIRSNHQAYAYLFSDTKTQKTVDRLKAIKTAKNGFELAEFDLQFRGTGDLYGRKQWGVSDLGMEAIRNIKMVEAARTEAQKLTEGTLRAINMRLKKLPTLMKSLEERREVHFE